MINQTRKYLVQQLQCYGEEFMTNIANNNVLMYAIQDYGIHKTDGSRKIEPSVYMLFDVNGRKKYGNYLNIHESRSKFNKSLLYFQKHNSYVNDYCYDSNRNGHLHVIVLKLPFPEKFHIFMKGNYSEMYSPEEINTWFVKTITKKVGKENVEYNTDQFSVLTRDINYFPKFKDKVYKEFGTRLTDDETKNEYDFPPHLNNEILRYEL